MKLTYIFRLFFFAALFVFSTNSIAQTKRQTQKIKQENNQSKLNELQSSLKQKSTSEKTKAVQLAKQNGWPLIIEKDGSYAELQKVTADGKPIYYTTYNVNAAKSTRADYLNIGGGLGLSLDGQNMTAHVWDGGLARGSHQEYDGPGGNNRFSIGDGTTTLNYHSAHVTGTIIASGVVANAKGMAPQAKAVGYEWNNDTSEATTAASNGMLISNHSYGYIASGIPDQWFGAYGTDARDWDQIMFNAPYYLMVVAAGNDGNDNSSNGAPLNGNSSYDKLSGHATAKNNMVVANGQDASIDANGNLNSVTINSSSSEGPTDDYRIKPDITGNGTSVYSTYESSNTAYNSITGTSMASPNVAGTLLLLQQHYDNINGNFMRAATLKGLALHTADDAGPTGPDVIYGWGLLNGKAAAEAITNNGNQSVISELTLSPGQTYTTTVTADGINDLMASISWTDPAGTVNSGTNSTTAALVNDLDIRISNGTTYFPYKLTSITSNTKADNTVDPYERVNVANASGNYTITVTHKGSLSSSQNFSLVITGVASNVTCNATTPTSLAVANVSDSSAQVSWGSVAGATYDVRYKTTSGSTWTTNSSSSTSTTLNGLVAETQYEVQVRSKCTDGSTSNYTSSINFTTLAIQLNYCTSQGNNINDEYIQRVQLNTINNASGASSGYTDFTAISTDLTQGTAYTITVTPLWTGTVYSEGYAVWIDYNYDGDFNDAGELVWSNSATQNTPVSGTFTVPTNSSQTATRMRVSMKYNGIPTSCESFTYGEVEDYTVNIIGGNSDTEAPTVPSNLTASNTTQTTTDLSWTASTDNVGVTGYDIYQGTTVIGTTASTSYTVTGLSASTTYSFTVVAKDAAGNESAASNSVSVTTIDSQAPTVPSNLTASNTTQTSTDLSWTASTDNVGVTGYDVYQGASVIGTTAGITYNVTGLSASSGYSFTVVAKDAAGNESGVSSSVSVTTLDPPDTQAPTAPTSLAASNTTQTTTDLSWTASLDNVGVTDYDVYQGASVIGTTASTSYNVIGLTASTSYSFSVRAKDAAGNVSGASNTVSVTTSANTNTGCSGGITTYPYTEGYENTIGDWTQSSADDINWTVDANGTPSSNTGPSSATQGTYYIYVEASGNGTGYPNKQAIINSPCYDLSAETLATFNFKYHMYGASDMGSIALEASDDNGVTWTSIWSMTGNQGNSWLSVTVDLASYLGGSVQLRFNRITGSTWQADIAIDDVSLTTTGGGGGGGNNCAAANLTLNITFDNYPEETAWTLKTSGGTTVASNSYSTANPDGSSITETINNLASGDYVFTITDSYGDGICCAYGNGSYTLSSSVGTIVSGGSFTSSDVTNFCVDSSKAPTSNETSLSNITDSDIRIYPNPVKFVLEITTMDVTIDSIKIFNMYGALVKTINLSGSRANVDVSQLASGAYFIRFISGDNVITKKFIKE
ncbi:MAG: peptidase S8 [Flavobacterium sp.]|nr:MAG: peptidase S8 [Flavobacterium sp.]